MLQPIRKEDQIEDYKLNYKRSRDWNLKSKKHIKIICYRNNLFEGKMPQARIRFQPAKLRHAKIKIKIFNIRKTESWTRFSPINIT
jgi:hypothetical protein